MTDIELVEGDALRVKLQSGETFILTPSAFTGLDIRVGDGRRQLMIEPQSMKMLTLHSVNDAMSTQWIRRLVGMVGFRKGDDIEA